MLKVLLMITGTQAMTGSRNSWDTGPFSRTHGSASCDYFWTKRVGTLQSYRYLRSSGLWPRIMIRPERAATSSQTRKPRGDSNCYKWPMESKSSRRLKKPLVRNPSPKSWRRLRLPEVLSLPPLEDLAPRQRLSPVGHSRAWAHSRWQPPWEVQALRGLGGTGAFV